jgi:hypothetical protein
MTTIWTVTRERKTASVIWDVSNERLLQLLSMFLELLPISGKVKELTGDVNWRMNSIWRARKP